MMSVMMSNFEKSVMFMMTMLAPPDGPNCSGSLMREFRTFQLRQEPNIAILLVPINFVTTDTIIVTIYDYALL